MKQCSAYLLTLLVFISSFAFGGEQPKAPKAKAIIISGKISDTQNNESLAGVKISCSNCGKVFYSNLDGRFFIYLDTDDAKDLKLEFSQIGYTSKSLDIKELQTGSDNLSVDLKSE